MRVWLVAVVLVSCGSVDDKGGGGDVQKDVEATCEASRAADELNAAQRGDAGVCHACFDSGGPSATDDGPTCTGQGYWVPRQDGAVFQKQPGFTECEDVPAFVPKNCAE